MIKIISTLTLLTAVAACGGGRSEPTVDYDLHPSTVQMFCTQPGLPSGQTIKGFCAG